MWIPSFISHNNPQYFCGPHSAQAQEINNSLSITVDKWDHIVTQATLCIRESLMVKMQLYGRKRKPED